MRSRLTSLALPLILLSAILPLALPQANIPNTTLIGGSGQIAYVAWTYEGRYVALLDIATQTESNLSLFSEDTEGLFSWSPHGEFLAISAYDRAVQRFQIFIIQPETQGISQVIHTSGDGFYPQWSPDGNYLAFPDTGDCWQKIVEITTGSTKCIKIGSPIWLRLFLVDWSPDSRYMLMNGDQYDDTGIFIVSSNGSTLNNLLHLPDIIATDWSPNGKEIIFSGILYPAKQFDLHIIDVETRKIRQITHTTGSEYSAKWSPDGNFIAYERQPQPGGSVIYVINSRSLATVNTFSRSTSAFTTISWSPDSNYIAFMDYDSDDIEIYIGNIHTGETLQITDNEYDDSFPAWRPYNN